MIHIFLNYLSFPLLMKTLITQRHLVADEKTRQDLENLLERTHLARDNAPQAYGIAFGLYVKLSPAYRHLETSLRQQPFQLTLEDAETTPNDHILRLLSPESYDFKLLMDGTQYAIEALIPEAIPRYIETMLSQGKSFGYGSRT